MSFVIAYIALFCLAIFFHILDLFNHCKALGFPICIQCCVDQDCCLKCGLDGKASANAARLEPRIRDYQLTHNDVRFTTVTNASTSNSIVKKMTPAVIKEALQFAGILKKENQSSRHDDESRQLMLAIDGVTPYNVYQKLGRIERAVTRFVDYENGKEAAAKCNPLFAGL